MLVAALGFVFAALAHSLLATLLSYTVAAVGVFSLMGPFWTLPTRVLGGQAAAGAVAIITMVGSVGSFLGPFLTGRLRDATHSFSAGLYAVAAVALAAAALSLALPNRTQPRPPWDVN